LYKYTNKTLFHCLKKFLVYSFGFMVIQLSFNSHSIVKLLYCFIVHCLLFFTKYELYEFTMYFYLFLFFSVFIVHCLLFFTKYELYECTNKILFYCLKKFKKFKNVHCSMLFSYLVIKLFQCISIYFCF